MARATIIIAADKATEFMFYKHDATPRKFGCCRPRDGLDGDTHTTAEVRGQGQGAPERASPSHNSGQSRCGWLFLLR